MRIAFNQLSFVSLMKIGFLVNFCGWTILVTLLLIARTMGAPVLTLGKFAGGYGTFLAVMTFVVWSLVTTTMFIAGAAFMRLFGRRRFSVKIRHDTSDLARRFE